MSYDYEQKIISSDDNMPSQNIEASVQVGVHKELDFAYVTIREPETTDSYGANWIQNVAVIGLNLEELKSLRDAVIKAVEVWENE